jgi:hypothetical protein
LPSNGRLEDSDSRHNHCCGCSSVVNVERQEVKKTRLFRDPEMPFENDLKIENGANKHQFNAHEKQTTINNPQSTT